jgi:hypothetical protein
VPGTVTVPLRSQTNASPFWIILLLVYARSEHGRLLITHGERRPDGPCARRTRHGLPYKGYRVLKRSVIAHAYRNTAFVASVDEEFTNCSALSEKYGANKLKVVLDATKALVAADKNRGLTTQLVDISNAATMKKFKRAAVKSSKNERQCKDAVDAIYASLKPDYLVLLDGPDVLAPMAKPDQLGRSLDRSGISENRNRTACQLAFNCENGIPAFQIVMLGT